MQFIILFFIINADSLLYLKGEKFGNALIKRIEKNIRNENKGLAKKDLNLLFERDDIPDSIKAKGILLLYKAEKDTQRANLKIYEFLLNSGYFKGKEDYMESLILYHQAKKDFERAEKLSKYLSSYSPGTFERGKIYLTETLIMEGKKISEIYYLASILKDKRPDLFIKALFLKGDSLRGFIEIEENIKKLIKFPLIKKEIALFYDNYFNFKKSIDFLSDSLEIVKRYLFLKDYEKAFKIDRESVFENRFALMHFLKKYISKDKIDSAKIFLSKLKNKIPADSFFYYKLKIFLKEKNSDSIIFYKNEFKKFGIDYTLPENHEIANRVYKKFIKGTIDGKNLLDSLYLEGCYQNFVFLSSLKDKRFLNSIYKILLRGEEPPLNLNNFFKNYVPEVKRDSLIFSKILILKGDTSSAFEHLPDGFLKGRVYFEKKDYEKAIRFLIDSPHPPDKVRLLYSLIKVNPDTAKIDYVLKKIPEKEILKYEKGIEFFIIYNYLKKNYKKIYEIYKMLKKENPDLILKYKNIFAFSLFKIKKFNQAFFLADKKLRFYILYYSGLKSYALRYKKYLEGDELSLVFKIYKDNLMLDSLINFSKKYEVEIDSSWIIYYQAIRYLRSKNTKDAESLLVKNKFSKKLAPLVFFQLGSINYFKGNTRTSEKLFKKALDYKMPDSLKLQIFYNLAVVMKQNENDSVIYVYDKIIKDFPFSKEKFWAISRKGFYYMDKNELEKSLKYFEEIEGYGDTPDMEMETKFFKAQVLKGFKRLKSALKEFLIVYRNYKKDLFKYTSGMEAGEIYEILGDKENAIKIYKELSKKGIFKKEAGEKLRELK